MPFLLSISPTCPANSLSDQIPNFEMLDLPEIAQGLSEFMLALTVKISGLSTAGIRQL